MKLSALFLSILFSGSLAFAHCGSCGTGDAKKGDKPACSKHEKHAKHGKKHAKGEKCACDKGKKKDA